MSQVHRDQFVLPHGGTEQMPKGKIFMQGLYRLNWPLPFFPYIFQYLETKEVLI